MDISDGLFQDLNHLCGASDVGASVWANKIPLSKEVNAFLTEHKFSIEQVITGGDDYEIIFTSHKKNRSLINKYAKSKKLKIQRIGKILKKHQDSCILKGNNKFRINKNLGYTHQF